MTDVMTRTCISEECDNLVPDNQGSDYCSVCIIADRPDEQMPKALFEALMEGNGITVTAEFVPFSKSRNKDEEHPSLNWKVTLTHHGRDLMTVDYGAGSGHCESVDENGDNINLWSARSQASLDAIKLECEDGKARIVTRGGADLRVRTQAVPAYVSDDGRSHVATRKTWETMPDPADVLNSLLLDGSAIDAGDFEDWAGEYGYDRDSIKAEAMYEACVETGLKLRNAFGETLLNDLREAGQDL